MDLGEGCRGAPPPQMKPPSSYSVLKFVYLTSQLCHSLEVHPLLRKFLDPQKFAKVSFYYIILLVVNSYYDLSLTFIKTRIPTLAGTTRPTERQFAMSWKIAENYSETLLIQSQTGRNNLAVLTGF